MDIIDINSTVNRLFELVSVAATQYLCETLNRNNLLQTLDSLLVSFLVYLATEKSN